MDDPFQKWPIGWRHARLFEVGKASGTVADVQGEDIRCVHSCQLWWHYRY